MPKIYACLAVSDVLILMATAVLGLVLEGRQVERHILLAVFTFVVTCFIQAVFFTYFVVTGKLMVQAVTLGRMAAGPVERSKSLKRSASVWVLVVMAGVLMAGGTGAARLGTFIPAYAHLVLGCVGLSVLFVAFYRQYDLVHRNATLVEETMQAYSAVRGSISDPPARSGG